MTMGDGPPYDFENDEWRPDSTRKNRLIARLLFGCVITLGLGIVGAAIAMLGLLLVEAPFVVGGAAVLIAFVWFVGYFITDLRPKIQTLRGGDDG